jgi:hypothetical protein
MTVKMQNMGMLFRKIIMVVFWVFIPVTLSAYSGQYGDTDYQIPLACEMVEYNQKNGAEQFLMGVYPTRSAAVRLTRLHMSMSGL